MELRYPRYIEGMENIKHYELYLKIIVLFKNIYNLDKAGTESFYVVSLDNNNISGASLISNGEKKRCVIKHCDIENYINSVNSEEFVVLHNHPASILYHSDADIKMFDEITEVFNRNNKKLLDSLVITRDEWTTLSYDIKERSNNYTNTIVKEVIKKYGGLFYE